MESSFQKRHFSNFNNVILYRNCCAAMFRWQFDNWALQFWFRWMETKYCLKCENICVRRNPTSKWAIQFECFSIEPHTFDTETHISFSFFCCSGHCFIEEFRSCAKMFESTAICPSIFGAHNFQITKFCWLRTRHLLIHNVIICWQMDIKTSVCVLCCAKFRHVMCAKCDDTECETACENCLR